MSSEVILINTMFESSCEPPPILDNWELINKSIEFVNDDKTNTNAIARMIRLIFNMWIFFKSVYTFY